MHRWLFFLPVFPAKALNATGRIQQLLFPSEEWMTLRTDFRGDFVFLRGPRRESIAAMTLDRNIFVTRMNVFFHLIPLDHDNSVGSFWDPNVKIKTSTKNSFLQVFFPSPDYSSG